MTAKLLRAAAAIVAIVLIGGLDYATGPRWGFSLFYLAPIVYVGWAAGASVALVAATIAALSWFLADAAWYADPMPSLWNGTTRLIVYGALGAMTAELRRDRERLRALLAQESRVARTDPLTGLVNSRAFYERVAEAVAHSRRHGEPLALLYVDLDDFKAVNDRFGHARGDELLQEIAAALRATLRASDVAARLGGDEFAMLLTDADRAAVEAIAARLVAAVDAVAARYPGTSVGASVGVAWFATPPVDAEAAIHAADQAMYRAKAAGKHRVEVA